LARKVFLDYLGRANSLHVHPEWYNALTNNCTTNIAGSVADARNVNTRLDWRILLNGKMDEMMYERKELVSGGLSLPALKEQAHINSAAKAAHDSPEFSNLIRQGRVGFSQMGHSPISDRPHSLAAYTSLPRINPTASTRSGLNLANTANVAGRDPVRVLAHHLEILASKCEGRPQSLTRGLVQAFPED
jgi:hypothetical protein